MMSEMYEWYLENLDSKKARESSWSIAQKILSSDVSSNSVDLHSDFNFADIRIHGRTIDEAPSAFRWIYGFDNPDFKSDLAREMLTWGADVGITVSPWTPSKMRAAAFARVLATIDVKS